MISYFGRSIEEIHCEFCCAPIDTYEPFETYKGRCCELYSEVLDSVFDDNIISLKRLIKKNNHLRKEYPDIPDFEATMEEIFDILEDCGVINYKTHKLKVL